jgi:Reverse transcriptase (RNA-dependent DNA polymerase)
MDKIKGAKFFTKSDVRWGYNNVRIKTEDQWKAAFKTNRGLFKPTVMFFGMCNSPATFQAMMDSIFSDMIEGRKVIVYMDDILIFGENQEELEEQVLQ